MPQRHRHPRRRRPHTQGKRWPHSLDPTPSIAVPLTPINHECLQGVSTVARITRTIEELKSKARRSARCPFLPGLSLLFHSPTVVEKSLDALPYPNLRWVQGVATGIDTEKKVLEVAGQDPLSYDKICICTGARPRRLLHSPHVVVLRDTDSVEELAARLATAQRAVVVGNGGIALELA
jgi:NADPH-dependent 2,4-dienoyl-CoA reductase/sulfur reductase-like enzyme